MVVWDGDEVFYSVNGSESIHSEDQESQITLFLERFREGKVTGKTVGPSFLGYLMSLLGMRMVYILVFLLAVMFLIVTMGKEEPSDTRDPFHYPASGSVAESDNRTSNDKED